jgi:hypothetical protein
VFRHRQADWIYRGDVPRQTHPKPEDRREAIRFALAGVVSGGDLGQARAQLIELHRKGHIFPADDLLELAAEAIEESGAMSAFPVEYDGIREQYLPERTFRGKIEHHRSHYALSAAAMIRAGVYPDLFGEVSWWHDDDLWVYAFYALVVYVRVAAERTERSVVDVARVLATRRGLEPGLVN